MSALNVQQHTDPAVDAFAITPNDSADIAECRFIYVGGAGNITCRFGHSTTNVLLTGVLAGTILAIRPTRIMSTGTTATALVGLN